MTEPLAHQRRQGKVATPAAGRDTDRRTAFRCLQAAKANRADRKLPPNQIEFAPGWQPLDTDVHAKSARIETILAGEPGEVPHAGEIEQRDKARLARIDETEPLWRDQNARVATKFVGEFARTERLDSGAARLGSQIARRQHPPSPGK